MNNIAEVLIEKGVTKTWLAQQLGKSKASVTLYSKNMVQPPLDVLFEIAAILDVDPKDLINSNPKKK